MGEHNHGGANLEAYERYTRLQSFAPVTIIDGGMPGTEDDYVQVDYNSFRGLDAQTTAGLVDTFARAVGNRLSRDEITDENTPLNYTQEEARTWFAGQVQQAQAGVNNEWHSGGGRHKDGVVLMDSNTASFDEAIKLTVDPSINISTPGRERLYDQYLREHETAHQMLGLNEAGSDYIASVRLLQRFPGAETRDFLQNMADARAIAPFRAVDAGSAGEKIANYGYRTSNAIQGALNAPPSETSNLSVDDMYEQARVYSAVNPMSSGDRRRTGQINPEMEVRNALNEANPNIVSADRYQDAGLTGTAKRLLDSDRFADGTLQRDILENIYQASGRMDEQIRAMPAPRPTVQPSVQPSAAPSVTPMGS